jgi:hypothetical protein
VDACLAPRCLETEFLYIRAFAWRGPHGKQGFSIVLSLFVFTELLLGNTLIKSVTISYVSVFICSIVLALKLAPVAIKLASTNEELHLIIIYSRLQSWHSL